MAIYVRKPDGSYVQLLDPNIFEQDATNYYWTIKDSSITLSKLAFKTMYLEAYAEGSGTSVEFTGTTVSNGLYLIHIMLGSSATVYLYINGDTAGNNYYCRKFTVTDSGTSYDKVNDAIIMESQYNVIVRLTKNISGYPNAMAHGFSGAVDIGNSSFYTWTHCKTVSDITSIRFTFSSSVDYKIYLYKLKI